MEELCAQVLKELKLGKQAFLRSSRQKSSQILAHTRSSPPNFLQPECPHFRQKHCSRPVWEFGIKERIQATDEVVKARPLPLNKPCWLSH
jgi:hypothetical protein